jgi:FHA domain
VALPWICGAARGNAWGRLLLTSSVLRPVQLLGELHLGLESANQRVLFGRIPSCDVHLEVLVQRPGCNVVKVSFVCYRMSTEHTHYDGLIISHMSTCFVQHLSVSRHHATLTLDPSGHLFLTDLGAGGIECILAVCVLLI